MLEGCDMQRREIEVHGIVQGVGFRPHVYSLARRLGLGGFVQNRLGAVRIEVEGEPASLDRFCAELEQHPPALARIESVRCQQCMPIGEDEFSIAPSAAVHNGQALVTPDLAACTECVAELFDLNNRRYRYPFISCTHCGPRLTIVTGAPYDRSQTTMAPFKLCHQCQAEYDDPGNRRFHAQTIACDECGPRLTLYSARGEQLAADDPLATFAAALRQGKLGAIKGLGGYHLCCDASNAQAVKTLRSPKHRDEKPFAIMVANAAAAAALCEVNRQEHALLLAPSAPIVLLRRLASSRGTVADAVAPGNPFLGVMLPYTPLHHLLLEAMLPVPLVMTSGNHSDEPIAYRDNEVLRRLADIADLFLMHDRQIHVRCDDSVTRIATARELPVRRSRGLAPAPIRLPLPCPRPILAVGGQLKGAFALGSESQAVVSHHLGDLDHLEAYRAFERDIALYENLFGIKPKIIAHDLHPDYVSTRYAEATDLQKVPVQHHHAHLASCMAEHGLMKPVVGVIFDGAGLGTDGAIWGGEFLVGDYRAFQRASHLRYVAMPGGEQAAKEPWRMAASHLLDAGCDLRCLKLSTSPEGLRTVTAMIERTVNSPLTSSMGRLFDAVAAIVGIRARSRFEGQAAIELEWQAMRATSRAYSWELSKGSATASWIIDTRPMIREVAKDVAAGVASTVIARRFHSTVVEWIADVCSLIRTATGLEEVVLSGGVFMNALLTSESVARLSEQGFTVYTHRNVPANDGGLSLGQLMAAAQSLGK